MTQPTPSQNAFDLLKSGGIKFSQSQKQTGKKRRASADQQDKYATCPVCGLSVPKAFIELHASDCLVKPSQRPSPATPAATPTPAAAAAAGVGASAAAGARAGSRSALSVPASHLAPAAPHQQQVDGSADKPLQAPGSRNAGAADDVSAAPNAFAIMAAAQAAQVPLEASLFLESRSDGSWACHWWSEGTPCAQEGLTAAWSATINAVIPKQAAAAGSSGSSSKGPDIPNGSTKLRLQIATNLPTGFGAAVDWSNEQLPSNHRHEQQQQQQQDPQQLTRVVNVSAVASNGFTAGADAQAAAGSNVGASSSSSSSGSREPLRWRGGVPMSISALQKCIRRGQAGSATRLALYLLKEPASCEALLRRLSIICLEDGLLHPQLPLVVWAMLAVGKGYVISGNLANALLAITYQMAAVEWRDFLPDADSVRGPAAAIYQSPRTWQAVDALLPPACPEALLVRAMLIRAAYGGMDGDKELLLRFSGLWLARFSGTAQPPPELPQLQQQQQALPLHTPKQQQQDGQTTGQESMQQAQQQQQQQEEQQQQQAVAPGLPGRKGPASFEGAAAAGSPWLTFLRAAYQDLWQGLIKLSDPKAAPVTNIMLVGPLLCEDIPLAAVDFHVTPGLTEHLLAQQQLQAAMRAAASTCTPIAAQLTGLGAAALVNSTLWLFRSSYNRKAWLQERYQQQQAGGYAQQVLAMELDALNRWKAEQRSKRAQLLPVWRVMALLADAWSREHIQKRVT